MNHDPNEQVEQDEIANSYEPPDDNMSDVEADADTLRSCGWGTDEDYGCYNSAEGYDDF